MSSSMLSGKSISSTISSATNDSMQPPPGYIFQEIVNTTHANPNTCDIFEKYIFQRLKKNNANIKWKCLLIIKHVTPKANMQFKRCMQAHVKQVKECLQFRGPPHPTYGDSLYKRVRDEAKEALDSIFRETQPTRNNNSLQSRIQGISGGGGGGGGSRNNFSVSANANAAFGKMDQRGSYRGGGNNNGGGGKVGTQSMGSVGTADAKIAYGGINGRKMQGFGNPNFNNGPKKLTMMEKMAEAAKKKMKKYAGKEERKPPQFMNNHTGAATYGYANNRGAGNNSVNTNSSYSGPNGRPVVRVGSSQQNAPGRSRGNSFERKKGTVGGVWGNPGMAPGAGGLSSVNNNNNKNNHNRSSFGGNNGSSTSTFDRRDSGSTVGGGKAGLASKDGEYERNLVNNMCNAGGLRAVPATNLVTDFKNRCKSLNADVVGPLLVAKIDEEDWKINIKALVVMEAMAKDAACAAYADYFYDNKEAVEDLLEDTDQKTVRTRCRRVLKALGVEGYEDIAVEETTRKRVVITGVPKLQPKPKVEESLLDVNVEQTQDLASEFLNGNTSSETNQNSNNDDTMDLLGELTIDNNNNNSNGNSGGSNAPPAPSTTATGFDFLASSATTTTATTTANTQQQNNSNTSDDLLGGLLAPMSTTALDPTTTVSSSSSNAGNATGNTSTNSNSDPFADLLGGTSSSSNNNTGAKTTTTTGLSGGTISSFNFMANSTSGNTTTNNMSMQSGSGLDRIKQAQEMARMQQMQQFQKMQRMQQMQMMKRMQQGGVVPQQMTGMNMGMPAMNTGMNTGVYAAGSVKSINLLGEQQNNAAKKKETSNAFNFVNDVLK